MKSSGVFGYVFSAMTLCFASAAPVLAQTQGVGKSEVVIGYVGDLSGPVAGYGKDIRDGMIMHIDEVNARGGVHGRKIRLLVEDNAYDPKRTVLAVQKLVNKEKIFAAIGTFGTVHAQAAMQIQDPKGVFNLFPMALAREMYEPISPLHYAWMPTYFQQISAAVPVLYKQQAAGKACVVFQDDDFGQEVVQGAEAGLKKVGATLVERASFKRNATDFSSQVARIKNAGCDFVVLGTLIRETVGVISEAHKLGYTPKFLVSSNAYTDLIPKLGGAPMDGLYASHHAAFPYLDDASEPVRAWANRYETKFKQVPSIFSAYGYTKIDIFVRALEKAGPDLKSEDFVHAMESIEIPADIFGNPSMRFSDKTHLASDKSRLSRLENGRWKVVFDYDQMSR
ncbi:MAG: ABC transporter substrate-binding protein [Burkholderiales bacterium 66-5]|uniref:ABC transporter substrate-binding protein n=1 Tax=Comamonas badia TaxID=265291 RepID=UPI000464CB66|nr:ABC transporter substrate-binding protein [Comamonas badia]OJU91267.1 MAG: ABC transporter substrate-binding protein [Burkholderiales bacterium 66-5]